MRLLALAHLIAILLAGCADMPVEPSLDFDRDEVPSTGAYLVRAQLVGGLDGADFSGWSVWAEYGGDGAWQIAPIEFSQVAMDGSALSVMRIDGWLDRGESTDLRPVASDDNGDEHAGAAVPVRVREW